MARERKRVRLVEDYADSSQGYEYKKGQTGVCYGEPFFRDFGGGRESTGSFVVVYFDGYDDVKRQDEKLKREQGEGFNVVPFLAEIPVAILEVLTD